MEFWFADAGRLELDIYCDPVAWSIHGSGRGSLYLFPILMQADIKYISGLVISLLLTATIFILMPSLKPESRHYTLDTHLNYFFKERAKKDRINEIIFLGSSQIFYHSSGITH